MKRQFLPFAALLYAAIVSITPARSMNINLLMFEDEHCGNANGYIDVSVNGGSAPYTYSWSNGAITKDISGLVAGTYTLTVTDALAQQVSQDFPIANVPYLTPGDYPAQDSHANCPGHCWGEFRVPESYLVGVAPFSYSEPVAGYDVLGEPYFYVPGGACGGATYAITITDATGCAGVMNITIVEPQIGSPPMAVSNITGSCTGGAGGSVTLDYVFDGIWFTPPNLDLYDVNDQLVQGIAGPGSTATFSGLPPGMYHVLRNWNPSYQYTAFACDDGLGFEIPDLGVACGTVSGSVFIDNDQDCTQDVAEVSVPELVLEIQPGPTYAITNQAGHYLLDLADGNYSLEQNDASLIQHCPVTAPLPFTIAGDAQVIDMADSSTAPLDIQAWIDGTVVHPGFGYSCFVKARNLSAQVSGPVTMTLVFDAALTYVSASLPPSDVTGTVITWDLPALTAYAQTTVDVLFDIPASVPLGVVLYADLTVTNTLPDANLGNNGASLATTTTGSFDPNNKTVRTSTGLMPDIYMIDQDEYLDYTIRFQNTGTDTAFTVVVTDTLSETLDMATFQQGVASHAYELSFKPNRVVEWRFANILLPDSGANEVESHGLVQFRMRPVLPLLPGTSIENIANIYFDFNPPVITEPSVLTAEFSTGVQGQAHGQEQMRLLPNPASDHLYVSVDDGSIERIRILAMDGRVVQTFGERGTLLNVDVSRLPGGVYLLLAELNNSDRVLRERFVKQ